jgi:hypothetical protein
MAFPERDYLRLEEVSERWGVTKEDVIDCALQNKLHLSVFVCNTPLIYGEYRTGSDGEPFPVHADRIRYSGLQNVTLDDLFQIRYAGQASIQYFKPFNGYQYVQVADNSRPLAFKANDVVIDRQECERFEKKYDLADKDNNCPFQQENDFRIVRLDGLTWHLGDTQAAVIKKLYEAAMHEENPWLHGKKLLQEAGSSAFRMRDLFNSQPNWQKLIVSNKRGHYRLNLAGKFN